MKQKVNKELVEYKSTVDYIKTCFKDAKKFRSGKEVKWDTFYKLYRAYLDQDKYPWRANLFIPYVFQTIETIVPRLVANQPELSVRPETPADEGKEKTVEELLDFQWRKMDMDSVLEDMTREGLKYGTSFVKTEWNKETMLPETTVVDILDLYIDPHATTIKDAKYVIHRTFRDLEDLKSNPNYSNLDLLQGVSTKDDESTKAERYAVQGMTDPFSSTKGKIEILSYYTKDKLTVIANQKVIIRDEANPYGEIPFAEFKDYPVAFELYGIGEAEHLESLQEEGNSLRNQILDNNSLINNVMYEQDPTSTVNVRNIVSKPGQVLPKGLKPFIHPSLSPASFNIEAEIKNDVQSTTGVTDYSMGNDNASLNKTATGIGLIQDAGNQRFKIKMRHLETTIKRIGEMMLKRNQQFITDTYYVPVQGKEGLMWKEINPESISGNFYIIPEAGSTQPVNKDIERQQATQMITGLANLQQLSQGQLQINWYEIATDFVESYGKKNPDKYVQQPAPMQGGASPVQQMLETLGPDGTAQYIKTLPPEDQQVMNAELQKVAGQAQGGQVAA